MIAVTTYLPNGKVHQVMTLKDEAEADMNGDWIEGHWDGREYYVVNGEAVARPGLDLPQAHNLQVDEEWLLPGVPSGTVVTIDGVEVGTTDGGPLLLSFPVALTYRVDLRAPFPWKPHTAEVTVNAPDT